MSTTMEILVPPAPLTHGRGIKYGSRYRAYYRSNKARLYSRNRHYAGRVIPKSQDTVSQSQDKILKREDNIHKDHQSRRVWYPVYRQVEYN